jgi:hypothetical protein
MTGEGRQGNKKRERPKRERQPCATGC